MADGWLDASEASRAEALQKCVDAPKMVTESKVAKDDVAMQVDGEGSGRGRSRTRSGDAEEASMDVDGAAPVTEAPARRGPNQYKKQGLLKRGAKARAGVNKKTSTGSKRDKKAPVRQHGVQVGGKKTPRFSKTSNKSNR